MPQASTRYVRCTCVRHSNIAQTTKGGAPTVSSQNTDDPIRHTRAKVRPSPRRRARPKAAPHIRLARQRYVRFANSIEKAISRTILGIGKPRQPTKSTSRHFPVGKKTVVCPRLFVQPPNRYAWYRFETDVSVPEKGYYEIWARAFDDQGQSQPFRQPWNPKGYLGNVIHRVPVMEGMGRMEQPAEKTAA